MGYLREPPRFNELVESGDIKKSHNSLGPPMINRL
jgi:hypothetical protein